MTINVFSVGTWLVPSDFLETFPSKHNLFVIYLNSILMNIRKVMACLWHIWYLHMHYLPRVFNLIKNACIAYLSWCISNRSCHSECGSYLSDSNIRFIRCPKALGSPREQREGEAATISWLKNEIPCLFWINLFCTLTPQKESFFFLVKNLSFLRNCAGRHFQMSILYTQWHLSSEDFWPCMYKIWGSFKKINLKTP